MRAQPPRTMLVGKGVSICMKVDIQIDQNAQEPYAVIYAREVTGELFALAQKWRAGERISPYIIGYSDGAAALIRPQEIVRIYTQQKRVLLETAEHTYAIRQRLYEMMNMELGAQFVRISQSEIVNFDRVKSFDISLAGSMAAKLDNGKTTFVSRRYVPQVKAYLGL